MEEINNLDHFSWVSFFDPITAKQMRDVIMGVLVKEKINWFSELFSIELKLKIDTLVNRFNSTFKAEFLELSDIQKPNVCKRKFNRFLKNNLLHLWI